MLLKPCCLKEQFCVLWMEDLEQKDGEAQGSTVRHMLSIKRPAINTRYTAPGQHDRSPGGGGGSPEEGRKEGIRQVWKKVGVQKQGREGRKDKMRKTKKGRKPETEEGRRETRVKGG